MRLLIFILSLIGFTAFSQPTQQILLQSPKGPDTTRSNLWNTPVLQKNTPGTGSAYAWSTNKFYGGQIKNTSSVNVQLKRFSLMINISVNDSATNDLYGVCRTTGALTNGAQYGVCSATNKIWYGAAPGHNTFWMQDFVFPGAGVTIPANTDFFIGAVYHGQQRLSALEDWDANGNSYEVNYGLWLDDTLHLNDPRGQAIFEIYILPQTGLADVTAGLAARWNMDYTNGITLGDASPNGNTLYFTNLGAANLSGTWSNYWYASSTKSQVPDSPSLNMVPNGNMSLTAWIYSDSNDSNFHCILAKNQEANQYDQYGFYLDQAAGRKPFGFFNGTNWYTSTNVVELNRWTHVAATVSGTNVIYYYNGRIAGTATNAIASTNNGPVHLFYERNGDARYFSGVIDEVRIYNTTLSAADIRTIATWHPNN